MNKKLKFVHVGTGGFGEYWCRFVLPKVTGFAEIVAAVDINADTHKNAIEYANVPYEKCYTDLQQALKENKADFITIVVPPEKHESVVDLALKYNLDILSEKPIAGDMDAACRILKKVRKAQKKMAVTMSHTHEVDKQTLKNVIQSGKYGDLGYIVGRLNLAYDLNSSYNMKLKEYGEIIYNGTIHSLDTIRAIAGSRPKTVYAQIFSPKWNPKQDGSSCLVTMEMENGIFGTMEMSANAHKMDGWSDEYYRAECQKATVILDHRSIEARSDIGYPCPTFEKIPLCSQERWDHAWIMEMFVNWLNGGEEPDVSLDNNMQCAALTYAAVESAKTSQVVNVQDYLNKYLEKYDMKL